MGSEEPFGAFGARTYSITPRTISLVHQPVEKGVIERYICGFEERQKLDNNEITIAEELGEYVELLGDR